MKIIKGYGMSRIDRYRHKLLGFINCDSDYDFVNNNSTRRIAIYKLEQDIPLDETDFDGKKGDLLLGGGSGEAPTLRISNPRAFDFFSDNGHAEFEHYDELFKLFWSATQSFKLCNGFLKSNWSPDEPIEFWLTEQVCKLLSAVDQEFEQHKFKGETSALVFASNSIDSVE